MSHYNDKTVKAADKTVKAMIDEVVALRGHGVVIGEAPAGAGKSYAIATAVLAARKNGLRVAVATPTNEQAHALVDGIADRAPRGQIVSFVHASGRMLPAAIGRRRNVAQIQAKDSSTANLLIGTLSKLGDAHARGDLDGFDLLLIDEAFQANSVHYYAVGGLAERHLLMGDRGQLAPFSTAPEGHRWRGLDEDPLLTAVEVVQRNHADRTSTHKLPITRRLDPRGAQIAKSFYPGHHFEAAVRNGIRELQLSGRRRTHSDDILRFAAREGWAHLELDGLALSLADPQTIEVILQLVRDLFSRKPTVRCERQVEPRPLEHGDVAIAVSHNDQKNLLRAVLDDAGFENVVVNTANKLQGLTYEVVIAWHPLAGLSEVCITGTRRAQSPGARSRRCPAARRRSPPAPEPRPRRGWRVHRWRRGGSWPRRERAASS